MKKKALITGVSGQDGAYLALELLNEGFEVLGGLRRISTARNLWRLEELGILDKIKLVPFELSEQSQILRVIREHRPAEVYNLAAQSFVGSSFDVPLMTADINALGTLRLLEAIRDFSPETRFYQASTSEMFGKVQEVPQTEKTSFYPRSPYGVAKLFGHWATVNYREAHNLFACSGILFNHESPFRGEEFVTRKITRSLARIKLQKQQTLALGNFDARRDWGYAQDFVKGMKEMLRHSSADDYVLATGEMHTVQEFVTAACSALDIPIRWEMENDQPIGVHAKSGLTIVRQDPAFLRPAEVDQLCGDPSKARKVLGWSHSKTFPQLVELMAATDYEREKKLG